jgi:shikimate kinase/3-dehydroquinate synthase
VLDARVQTALARHLIVLLDVDADTAWARVRDGADGDARPLARDRAAFGALLAERRPVYERLADAILPADAKAAVAALGALQALASAPPATHLLWAQSASGDYPVFAGPALLESGFWPPIGGRRFGVSDRTVADLHGPKVEPLAGNVLVDAGEASKSLAGAEHVWRSLAQQGMTRDDHVVALGGGVVGDLAGFCAATYQRGVPVLQVPTTLVSQVDSAYGGKTGIDIPEAKNYVGAFHQPAAVLVDPATLLTLAPEELAAGYAEVVKTALIAGGPLWERIAGGMAGAQPDVVLACARTKLAVVAADERDGGRRQVLNLGHTVGHAIETATGYERYRHGEAVALGMLAALRLSGVPELRDQVVELFASHGLPVTLDAGADIDAIVAATRRDKKRRGEDDVPFVLVRAPGDVVEGQVVPPDDLIAAVRELLP